MKFVFSIIVVVFVASCTTNNYEPGDGTYSYMRADFVSAHTSAPTLIDYAITDDDQTLTIAPSITANWATTPDSLYRSLLYYNVGDGEVSPIKIEQIAVLKVYNTQDVGNVYTDPLAFESAWISNNKKFFNISFGIKTGKAGDNDSRQSVGMACDSIVERADGGNNIYFRMLHNQNNVPQYYTSQQYASVSMEGVQAGDSIHFSVNTYEGEITKALAY